MQSKQLLVYVAGPFRDTSAWKVELNIRKAEELGLIVAQAGHFPIVPHTMGRFYSGEAEDSFWLDWGIRLLSKCDAMILVKYWEHSAGTRAEYDFAVKNKIKIFELYQGNQWSPRSLAQTIQSWKAIHGIQ